ncbi:MAG: ribonucleotide-diphosphate reductase subunit beta [Rickettsiales bacterium]|nr:ribonucleotide-diphosphate reductase subunit beta [Rickettsiales bacterium]
MNTTLKEKNVFNIKNDDFVSEKESVLKNIKNTFKRKKIFNPDGNDTVQERRVLAGNVTNIFNLNNAKYSWANRLYRVMMENFWIPEKIGLADDARQYSNLTTQEKKAFDGILSFLTFLDSIQTNNLPNISNYITAPEICLLLAIQTYQEAIHSQSYAYMIESIIPVNRRNEIYDFWRKDSVLFERNKYIAQIYQDFVDNQTDKSFAKVLIANFLLEGLYFYNGFAFFYNLASRGLMMGSADEIKYINRDELTHCVIFSNMIKEIRKERPDFFDEQEIISMFKTAVEQEMKWTNHIIGDGVLGINKTSTEKYTKYLANKRLKELNIEPIYKEFTENPYLHLVNISDERGEGSVKTNFFESNVSAYNQSSVVKGWDSF